MNQLIEVNIDELVLNGFSPADKHLIGQAIQNELTQVFSEHGIPSSLVKNGDQALLNAGSFQMNPNASPGTIGNQVAGKVYSGLNADKASDVPRS